MPPDPNPSPLPAPAPSASESLHQAAEHLGAGDLRQARTALAAARTLSPTDADAELASALERQLTVLERLAPLYAAFEEAREKGDWLAARAFARRAAALSEAEDAAAWGHTADQCSARVRAEWRIAEAEEDLPAEEALASFAGELEHDPAPCRLLADGGATLVLVSARGHWVFVREVDLALRRLRRLGWLRAPEPVEGWSPIQLAGESIRLVGSHGAVLDLSRRPLDVVRWTSLRPLMLPDRVVDDSFAPAGGRFLWAELEDADRIRTVVVMDLDEQRVHRRLPADFAEPVPGADPARVLGTFVGNDKPAELYDEAGTRMDWSPPGGREFTALAAHPGGAGFLAVVTAPEAAGQDDMSSPLGLLELLPGKAPGKPVVIADSHEESPTTLAVALDEQLAFLTTYVDRAQKLFAYRPGQAGLELQWSMEVPSGSALVQDARGRRVALLAPTSQGVEPWALGASAPCLRPGPWQRLSLSEDWPYRWRCEAGEGSSERARARHELFMGLVEARRAGCLDRWADNERKERRRDPGALAELIEQLADNGAGELAVEILAFALDRHPAHPQLQLARAHLEALKSEWKEVEAALQPVDLPALPRERACHVHHLRGLARLHSGDAAGARASFLEGERRGPQLCHVRWNLDAAEALLEPLNPPPALDANASPVRRAILACRRADACLARGDAAGARDALEQPLIHWDLELQSAARLAEAHLGLEPTSPFGVFQKAVALGRMAGADLRPGREQNLPGLGWGAERLATVVQRAQAWLDAFGRGTGPAPDEPRAPKSLFSAPEASPAPPPPEHPSADPAAPQAHALPPLGHESIRALVPGMDQVVREAARYVRALPGWDPRTTLGDDLPGLGPVGDFLADRNERLQGAGATPEDAIADVQVLAEHLGYCVNFELHRRKLFFADDSLAWMLAHTGLAIEARALRLPFPCFGLAFTDRATLHLAEAFLEKGGTLLAAERLQVWTTYVQQLPAPAGSAALSLRMVFDRRDGRWPILFRRELRFTDFDDLEDILDRAPGHPHGPELRPLVHLVLNAILYSTSADVPWPLARSRSRLLEERLRPLGKAKKARGERRLEDLQKQYSDEDVFYLPGRIPISQLRSLQKLAREPQAAELMSRFMVRGHWRRASPGWRDRRVRWIEPYWNGPELAALVEKEYKLKI